MEEDSPALKARAEQCRRLAKGVSTDELAQALRRMAVEYDAKADAAEAREAEAPEQPLPPPTPAA